MRGKKGADGQPEMREKALVPGRRLRIGIPTHGGNGKGPVPARRTNSKSSKKEQSYSISGPVAVKNVIGKSRISKTLPTILPKPSGVGGPWSGDHHDDGPTQSLLIVIEKSDREDGISEKWCLYYSLVRANEIARKCLIHGTGVFEMSNRANRVVFGRN